MPSIRRFNVRIKREIREKKHEWSGGPDHEIDESLRIFHRDQDGPRAPVNYLEPTTSIMAHSKRTRNLIRNHTQNLNRQLSRLSALSAKHNKNARIITLPIALGDLRKQYSPRHMPLSNEISNSTADFQRVAIDEDRPLFIYGRDGGLIAYRTALKSPRLLATLTRSIRELPGKTNHKFRGIYRGSHSTRHYCIWCPYAKTPFISKELREDGEAGLEFLKKNIDLWNCLSEILGGIAPNVYKTFLRYPLPDDLKRFCTAWAGCVVNIGTSDPVQTEPHRDVKESKFGYSCIVTAGDYTGGALICYELKLIIELPPGSCFFFPDALITHSNENTTGERSSIVAFTQENMFDYWQRKYGYINNKTQKNDSKE